MVFSSNLFLLYFFPAVFLLYCLSPRSVKNYVLLIASIAFYSWGAPTFICIVLLSVFSDFYIIGVMHRSDGRRKKILLLVSLALNIGLLIYFKYANFFVDNVNSFLASFTTELLEWTKIVLPVGISFFVFKKLSYLLDVYWKRHAPFSKISDYSLFILLFPELVAGPIVRFSEIADQIIERSKQETIDDRLVGLFRFIIGLSKKVLVANVLGQQVDKIFALDQAELTMPLAWIGIVAYSFQIYFDFSGYSDMAIGIARMLGFKFPENFNNPYISQSITEFWKRWHITLGRWMKDYLYVPLGGNRLSAKRTYFNLFLVFLLSGLWHGASWTFVAWGLFHGFFLILDRWFLDRFKKNWPAAINILLTYFTVLIGWVLFRATDLHQASDYLTKMFSFKVESSSFYFLNDFKFILIAVFIFCFAAANKRIQQFQTRLYEPSMNLLPLSFRSIFALAFLILCIGHISSSDFNPFIYFAF